MARVSTNTNTYPQYQLTDAEVARRTQELLVRFGPFVQAACENNHRAVCVAVDGTDPLSDLARNIECRAFETLADNLPAEVMRDEYAPYEDRSIFLIGIDLSESRVVATARLIVGTGGLGPPVKAIRDIVEHPEYRSLSECSNHASSEFSTVDRWLLSSGTIGSICRPNGLMTRRSLEDAAGILSGATSLDVSSLARVRDLGARDAGVTWTPLLAGAIFRLCTHLGIGAIVAFLTSDLLNAIRQLCGAPWHDLGGLKPVHYVPGDTFTSQPAFLDIAEFSETLDSRMKLVTRRPLPEVQLSAYAKDPSKADAFALW